MIECPLHKVRLLTDETCRARKKKAKELAVRVSPAIRALGSAACWQRFEELKRCLDCEGPILRKEL